MSFRSPETCLWRRIAQAGMPCECLLLPEIFRGFELESIEVDDSICDACCRTFQPTVEDLNPVLASLVFAKAESARPLPDAQGGGEHVVALRRIQAFAEESIPVIPGHDDDLPLSPTVATGSSHLSADVLQNAVPGLKSGNFRLKEWTVAITTAARRLSTLSTTVSTARAAGWERLHLFIDGDVLLPADCSGLPRTVRLPSIGAWQNYYVSLLEMLRSSDSNAFMLVQDDALWPGHLPVREYLEQLRWPDDGRFIASLYCCRDDTGATSGWRMYENAWRYGAVALIFSRKAAEEFVSDQRVASYCLTQKAGIDAIVGEWADRNHVPVFVPTPSLVQHIGDVSTLWRTSRAVGIRRASRYVGDEIPPPLSESDLK